MTDLTQLTAVKSEFVYNVRELRSSPEGREILHMMGSTDWKTARDYRHRPFVSWDGEGITYPWDTHQSYVLFGASSGHYVQGRSLPTVSCFRTMLEAAYTLPPVIHVSYSFQYDVEMMLCDLPVDKIDKLYETNQVIWNGYRIEYIPKKWFLLTGSVFGKRRTIRVWDMFSFFNQSFVKALEKYLPEHPDLDAIREGKAQRDAFSQEDLDTLVKPYWRVELQAYDALAERLRELLYEANIRIKRWHGPGAIASHLLKRNHTDDYRVREPAPVLDASQYAFAGGRFELFKIGRSNGPVYQYDINSAYPMGISQLPSLKGEWEYVENPTSIERFGVYDIEHWTLDKHSCEPRPLFYRRRDGTIHYPGFTRGWYWSPEANLVLDDPSAQIHGGWVLHDDGTYPFSWVAEMYAQRKEWKARGIRAEYALKLGINSLYGKMAQRAGWRPGGKIPRWHQLSWAGYVTSYTRAILWDAIQQAHQQDALIAAETDAVFSTVPLDLPISEKLGDWDYNAYDDIIYLQNGIYWALQDGKWEKARFRGLDSDSITVDGVLDYLAQHDLRKTTPVLVGSTHRFVGGKVALRTDVSRWRTWETQVRELAVGRDGKRLHNPKACKTCADYRPASESLHDLAIADFLGGDSRPHYIPWRKVEGVAEWVAPLEIDPAGEITEESLHWTVGA